VTNLATSAEDLHGLDGATMGYVLEVGEVFVSLKGDVYNTSCEVGQSLDLDTAVHRLLDS
jgi:hypothetical protein